MTIITTYKERVDFVVLDHIDNSLDWLQDELLCLGDQPIRIQGLHDHVADYLVKDFFADPPSDKDEQEAFMFLGTDKGSISPSLVRSITIHAVRALLKQLDGELKILDEGEEQKLNRWVSRKWAGEKARINYRQLLLEPMVPQGIAIGLVVSKQVMGASEGVLMKMIKNTRDQGDDVDHLDLFMSDLAKFKLDSPENEKLLYDLLLAETSTVIAEVAQHPDVVQSENYKAFEHYTNLLLKRLALPKAARTVLERKLAEVEFD